LSFDIFYIILTSIRRNKPDDVLIIEIEHALFTNRQNKSMNHLRDNQRCYVCGKKNAIGLSVDFKIDRETRAIEAKFIPSGNHEGYEGIVHGGILSSLLDEAMAKLAYSLGIPAVTAEITVKFKAPAAPGEELLVSGRLTDEGKRLILAGATITRGPVVIAEAKGKLLRTEKTGDRRQETE
jgi:acyl-coenzyme A thioesterase PaaI-like protein